MSNTKLHGVEINLDNLSDVKSLKDLKSTDIFSHLSNDEQATAYDELYSILKPKATKDTPPPAQDAANAAASGDVVNQE